VLKEEAHCKAKIAELCRELTSHLKASTPIQATASPTVRQSASVEWPRPATPHAHEMQSDSGDRIASFTPTMRLDHLSAETASLPEQGRQQGELSGIQGGMGRCGSEMYNSQMVGSPHQSLSESFLYSCAQQARAEREERAERSEREERAERLERAAAAERGAAAERAHVAERAERETRLVIAATTLAVVCASAVVCAVLIKAK
jgi:hypothetical protein